MKVVLYQEVKPQDGSLTLPKGIYEVADIKWIASALCDADNEEEIHGGLATFVVTKGEHAAFPSRRIGVVVEEEYEAERLVILLGFGIEEFESVARYATVNALRQAKKLFEEILVRRPGESRATQGIKFINQLISKKEV